MMMVMMMMMGVEMGTMMMIRTLAAYVAHMAYEQYYCSSSILYLLQVEGELNEIILRNKKTITYF